MRIRFLSLLALLLTLSLSLQAEPVSRQEAQALASNFLQGRGRTLKVVRPIHRAPRKAGTTTAQEDAYYYVFNADDGQGFVIVSGDDRTEQILGYSDEGSFDAANIPCNLAALLDGYAVQINHLDETGYAPTPSQRRKALSQPAFHPVAPLLKSLWDQGSPYSLKTPENGNTPTGCVATAISQVMYYHRWPERTIAEIPGYTDGNGHVLAAVPAGSVIDWANMRDTYSGTYGLSTAQRNAISNLMLWVGTSVNMTYESGGSGAVTALCASALPKFFDYDDDIVWHDRNSFQADKWFEMVYAEIADGRPVIYSGQSEGGGHAFVLDGFDGEGLFHVNWGWSGSSNGYYRIDVLSPGANAGIGASRTADGYTMSQGAAFGVHRPDGITNTTKRGAVLTTWPTDDTRFNVNDDGKYFTASFTNFTGSRQTFDMNIAIVEADGRLTPCSATRIASLGSGDGWGDRISYNFSIADLPAGSYKLVPVSKLSTVSKWDTDISPDVYYISVYVDAGGNFSHRIHPSYNLNAAIDLSQASRKVNSSQVVAVNFQNNGDEYNNIIHLYASQDADYLNGSTVESSSRTQVVVKAGESQRVKYSFTPNATGTWYLWLGTSKSNILASATVSIGTSSTYAPSFSTQSNSVENTGGYIYGGTLRGTATIRNTGSTYYDGDFFAILFKDDQGVDSYRVHLPIAAGQTGSFQYSFSGLSSGSSYYVYLQWIDGSDYGWMTRSSTYTAQTGSYARYNQSGSMSTGTYSSNRYTANSTEAAADLTLAPPTYATLTSAKANSIFYFGQNATVPSAFSGKNVVKGSTAASITLTDGGGAFFVPIAFTATNISYTRTFAAASDGRTNLQTIALPFVPTSITAGGASISISDVYVRQYVGTSSDGQVCLENVESMQQGVPYLIGVPSEYVGKAIVFSAQNVAIAATSDTKIQANNDTYTLRGATHADTYSSPLELNAQGTALVAAASTSPFRAYFLAQSGSAGTDVVMAEDVNGEDAGRPVEPVVADVIDRSAISGVSLAAAKDVALRAPSVPLIVNDPSFQVWSNGDLLNGQATSSASGNAEKAMNGYVRVDGTAYQFMGVPTNSDTNPVVLLPGAPQWDGCAYTLSSSDPAGWYALGSTPAGWQEGVFGPFNSSDCEGWTRTNWSDSGSKDLYVRRSFRLSDAEIASFWGDVYLRMAYDQDVVVYVNGTLLTRRAGNTPGVTSYTLDAIPVSLLRDGENLIAVKAGRGGGSQYLDFAIEYQPKKGCIELAEQKGNASVLATQSHYSFTAGGVDLDLTFTNPQMLDDVAHYSTPIDYISYKVTPNDGNDHAVQVYLTMDAGAFTSCSRAPMSTTMAESGNVRYVRSGRTSQNATSGDGAGWGWLYLAAPNTSDHQEVSFCTSPELNVLGGTMPVRSLGTTTDEARPYLIFRDDLRLVRNGASCQGYAVTGYDYDGKAVLHQDGSVGALKPYCEKQGRFSSQVVSYAATQNYIDNMAAARAWDETIYDDANAAGGTKYAEVASMAYRQTASANIVAQFMGEPVLYNVNVGAGQRVQAAEVTLAEAPLLATYNPELLVAGLLAPAFYANNVADWYSTKQYEGVSPTPYNFAPHYLGSAYPVLTQAESNWKMDTQASYLLASAAALRMDGTLNYAARDIYRQVSVGTEDVLVKGEVLTDEDWTPSARRNAPQLTIYGDGVSITNLYSELKQWATAMSAFIDDADTSLGRDPMGSFDDGIYAATALSGNVYLQAKCILALAAFAQVAEAAGDSETATAMRSTAEAKAQAWITANRSGSHYKQADNAAWGLKYALVFDQILGTNLFSGIMDDEVAYYVSQAGTYGVPVDARGTVGCLGYAYAAATMAGSTSDWQTLTTPVWNYVNQTTTRVPLRPFYDTTTGEGHSVDADNAFSASPMTGWLWAKVLWAKAPITLDEAADNRRLIALTDGQTRDVELKRTFSAGSWSTFVVPFDIDNATMREQFGNDVEVSTMSADALTGVTLTPMNAPAVEAGVPVIMRTSKTGSEHFRFAGVQVKADEPTATLTDGLDVVGNYAGRISIPASDAENSFYYVNSDRMRRSTGRQTIRGFRAWFDVSGSAGSAVKAFFEHDEFADGIGAPVRGDEGDADETATYNLAGQRVGRPTSGVYITNGVKKLIR